jgi:hypothetical protein
LRHCSTTQSRNQEVSLEIIAREFEVADIVMEVTVDKNLPKEERKRKQIEAGTQEEQGRITGLSLML